MPTLEERAAETPAALKKRLKQRMEEFGINDAFAEYMEMMEIYILKMERRMARLETRHNLDPEDIY
jgi:hypothetical protein